MSSMNNWLGFSLSPQELNSQTQDHESQNSVFGNSDAEVSGDQCFDLTSHDSGMIPSLNLPAPFGIFEGFNRNDAHSQGWNMKGMPMNTTSYSCTGQNLQENQETPKLENFLGHSFTTDTNHHTNDYHSINAHNNYNIYQETEDTSHQTNNNSTIGLSMIKNWLRTNPAPPHTAESKVDNEAVPPRKGPQTLSLSMNTSLGSQPNSVVLPLVNGNAFESCTLEKVQQVSEVEGTTPNAAGAIEPVARKTIDTFGQRTSIYRGVTRHRWTGRYEAHLWDNSCRREGQTRKGRQVYLGGYDKEDKAARSYDLAALKYWGTTTTTNFPTSNYEKEIEEMKHMTRQEYVASLRRKSSGFSRGASIYRGVTRHHQHGRWQARIGRVAGNKDLYLGTFSTQEEAAEAYDIAAIKFRGLNAVTNFEINRYDVKSILESSTLPIGGAAKRLKDAENAEMALGIHRANEASLNLHLTDNSYANHGWPTIAFQQQAHINQPLSMYPYARLWCKQELADTNTDVCQGFNTDFQNLGNTQNFLQTSVLHNLMNLDSSSMENSSGSNNFGVPIMNVQDHESQGFISDSGMFGSTDGAAYNQQQARNFYDNQGLTFNNWNIPTAVPTLATRANMWNDT